MLLKNNTGEVCKIGHTCKHDPRDPLAFVYANPNDSNILGIISESVPRYAQCNIVTSGTTKVFVATRVNQGAIIRAQKSSDRISRGTCTVAKVDDSPYFKIGIALQSGKGLLNCSINLMYESWEETQLGLVVITEDYFVNPDDRLIAADSTTAIVIYLPPALGSGRVLELGNRNIGLLTVETNRADGSAFDEINGEISQELLQWDCMTIRDYELGKWMII